MPERELRQRIRAALKRAFPGALVLQWPSNMWTGPGWPDLLYSEWPLLVGFEVKYGRRSKPTPQQRSRHVELRNHHVPVYVVYGPDDAVGTIHTLKERLPMAFDPDLLAELDAALSAPTPALQEEATADQNAADLANGTATLEELPVFEEVKLDAEAPAPDIEDLTAAIVANTELQVAETEAVLAVEGVQAEILVMLKESIDTLTEAINKLRYDLNSDIEEDDKHLVPQTAEAPAPRRRNSRRG